MVNRVVATKLTDEEHNKLLDACNKEGCTPSSFIKNALLEKIMPRQEKSEDLSSDEVRKFIGITKVSKSNEAIQEKKAYDIRRDAEKIQGIQKPRVE